MTGRLHIDRKVYSANEFRQDFLKPDLNKLSLKSRIQRKIVSSLTYSNSKAKKIVFSLFPFLSIGTWYDWKRDFISDVIAGFTVGIMQIPQGMAYALLASLPPVIGLYISFFPVIIYFFFGTSRQLSMGAIAVVSLMVGGVVESQTADLVTSLPGNLSESRGISNNTDPYLYDDVTLKKIQIASTLCFIVGIIQTILGLCRLGLVTTYMSEPLVKGFTCGAAVHVFTSQVKYALGLKIKRFTGILQIPYTYVEIFRHIQLTNIAELVISLVCIVILYLVKAQINQRFKKKLRIPIPIDLVVLIAATVASTFGFFREKYGIRVVGHIPAGLPVPEVPSFYRVSSYFSDSISITIIAFGQAVSLAVLLGKKHNYEMDSSEELFAYGLSNIFGSFFWCYPASAAVSRTSVSDSAGSTSQIYSLFSCALLLVVILWIGPLFKELPNCVLSAIVLVALRTMLLQILDLPMYWRISKVDCIVWIVTFLSVVILHVDLGLAMGIGFAIFTVVVRSQCTPTETVESVLTTEMYLTNALYKTMRLPESIRVVRFNSPLYYANSQMFQTRLYKSVGASPGEMNKLKSNTKTRKNKAAVEALTLGKSNGRSSAMSHPLQHIVIDMTACHFTDYVGSKVLKQISDDYSSVDVKVYLAGVRDEVYSVLSASGFVADYGDNIYLTVLDAVSAVHNSSNKHALHIDDTQGDVKFDEMSRL